jgi:hypothetical protein
MGFYTGRTGSLRYNGSSVAKIRDWSLETTVELLSTNDISSVANTFTPGVKGATGSATLLYYRLESGESSQYTQFTQLLGNIMRIGEINTNHRVRLILNVGNKDEDDIKLDAYITSAQVGSSTGELSTVSIQFTMDGDFVEVIE